MAALAMVCRAGSVRRDGVRRGMVCSVSVPAAYAAEAELHAAAKKVCLNAAETREMVKSRRLLEPFAALKFGRRAAQGRAAVGETLPRRRGFCLRDHPLAPGRAPRACRDGGRDGENRFAPAAGAARSSRAARILTSRKSRIDFRARIRA